MSKNKRLTPSQHIELGRTLKRARELLLEAGMATRCYGKLSRRFFDAAAALTEPRAWLPLPAPKVIEHRAPPELPPEELKKPFSNYRNNYRRY